MKIMVRAGQILSITLFVSGVFLYLLFANFHPLLHDHSQDGKHHHNCPACRFLVGASLSTIPDVALVPAIFHQVSYQIFLNYQSPRQQLFHKNHTPRSPPIVSRNADDIDAGAGEQKLDGWDVVNFRAGYDYRQLTFNIGIENIFDERYAVANSYEWDVVAGTGATPAIVYEPGRFFYAGVSYRF